MVVTNVDKLLKLLEKKKKTTVSEVSKTLNADEKQIEKIANYLMEEGVISVDYKLTGIALMLNPKEQKKAEKLMFHKFKVTKKAADIVSNLKGQKQVPSKISADLKLLVKRIIKKDLNESGLNEIQKSFEIIVAAAMKKNFFNKNFFNQVNQLYELIEAKKILLMINSYKATKDKKFLDSANAHYHDLSNLQDKLVEREYVPNTALKEQLKKTLKEVSK